MDEGKRKAFKRLRDALEACDVEGTRNAANEIVNAGYDALEAMKGPLTEGIRGAGDKFHRGEIFIPHLILGGDAVTEASKILSAAVPMKERTSPKKVVIGTVEGDIHDIGKDIVALALRIEGFEVIDIGKDVPVRKFIETAEKVGADIIASSALMSSCMSIQKDIIDALVAMGIRDKYKVMAGGCNSTKEWAASIGCDGWGVDAIDAARVAKKLVGMGREG